MGIYGDAFPRSVVAEFTKKHTRATKAILDMYNIKEDYIVDVVFSDSRRWRKFKNKVKELEHLMRLPGPPFSEAHWWITKKILSRGSQ